MAAPITTAMCVTMDANWLRDQLATSFWFYWAGDDNRNTMHELIYDAMPLDEVQALRDDLNRELRMHLLEHNYYDVDWRTGRPGVDWNVRRPPVPYAESRYGDEQDEVGNHNLLRRILGRLRGRWRGFRVRDL